MRNENRVVSDEREGGERRAKWPVPFLHLPVSLFLSIDGREWRDRREKTGNREERRAIFLSPHHFLSLVCVVGIWERKTGGSALFAPAPSSQAMKANRESGGKLGDRHRSDEGTKKWVTEGSDPLLSQVMDRFSRRYKWMTGKDERRWGVVGNERIEEWSGWDKGMRRRLRNPPTSLSPFLSAVQSSLGYTAGKGLVSEWGSEWSEWPEWMNGEWVKRAKGGWWRASQFLFLSLSHPHHPLSLATFPFPALHLHSSPGKSEGRHEWVRRQWGMARSSFHRLEWSWRARWKEKERWKSGGRKRGNERDDPFSLTPSSLTCVHDPFGRRRQWMGEMMGDIPSFPISLHYPPSIRLEMGIMDEGRGESRDSYHLSLISCPFSCPSCRIQKLGKGHGEETVRDEWRSGRRKRWNGEEGRGIDWWLLFHSFPHCFSPPIHPSFSSLYHPFLSLLPVSSHAGDSFGKSKTREKGMASLSLTSPPLGSLGRCKRQREGERSVFSFASLTPFLSYSFPMLSLSITSLYHRWNGGEERDKERNGLGASCVTSVTNK